MNIEVIIYGSFLIAILITLMLLVYLIIEKPEYTTRFYKYKVK